MNYEHPYEPTELMPCCGKTIKFYLVKRDGLFGLFKIIKCFHCGTKFNALIVGPHICFYEKIECQEKSQKVSK